MFTAISPGLLKALVDFTGEPRADLAIRLALRDAARFRLEELAQGLRRFEEKYGMNFPEFERAFQNEEIPHAYSYGETMQLSTHRTRQKMEEGLPSAEMRRRLGI